MYYNYLKILCYDSVLEVDLLKPEWAKNVQNALDVDKEIRPDQIRRSITTTGSILKVYFILYSINLLRS
jgi:hypothetical protein